MSITTFASIFEYLIHNLASLWELLQTDVYPLLFGDAEPWQISGIFKELYQTLYSNGVTEVSVLQCLIYLAGAGFLTYAGYVLLKFFIPI